MANKNLGNKKIFLIILYLLTIVFILQFIKNFKNYKKSGTNDNNTLFSNKILISRQHQGLKDDQQWEPKYPYSLYLEPMGKYQLFWNVDYNHQIIHFALKFDDETTITPLVYNELYAYWLGLGFSDYGELEGSDFCIITKIQGTSQNQNSSFQIIDSYFTRKGILTVDKKQSWRLENVVSIRNNNKNDIIYIFLSRKFDTCEMVGDYKIDRGTTHVMLIEKIIKPLKFGKYLNETSIISRYGKELPAYNTTNTLKKSHKLRHHLMAGSYQNWHFVRTQLLKPPHHLAMQDNFIHDDPLTLVLDVRMDNTHVNNSDTTYWSKLIRLPDYLKSRHHIIGYEKLIPSETVAYVHHMLLFHCEIPLNIIPPTYEGISDSADVPLLLKNCKNVIAAWTIGEGRGTTHVMLIEKIIKPLKFGKYLNETSIISRYGKELPAYNTTNTLKKSHKLRHHLMAGSYQNWHFVRTQLLKPPHHLAMQDNFIHDDPLTLVLDIRMNNTHVNSSDTTYWSKLIRLPDYLKSRHHIIGYEKLIPSETVAYVHHMLLFHCEIPLNIIPPTYEGISDSADVPLLLKNCKNVIAAWTIGEGPVFFPNQTGYNFGGSNYSLYCVLEVHYNNPGLHTGVVDSSGFRIYLTSKLRLYEVGYLEIGYEYNPKLMIPPLQKGFLVSGYCLSQCTAKIFPRGGIKVFANQFHTHLRGRKIIARHIRNGIELSPLNRDDHYSQEYQEIRTLPRIVTVLPVLYSNI